MIMRLSESSCLGALDYAGSLCFITIDDDQQSISSIAGGIMCRTGLDRSVEKPVTDIHLSY